jgi:dynein heavy chain, axonemal
LVCDLHLRLKQSKENINRVHTLMSVWCRVPLFERKDGRKDTLLLPSEQAERAQKRCNQTQKNCDKKLK